jgi:hypothetical protein
MTILDHRHMLNNKGTNIQILHQGAKSISNNQVVHTGRCNNNSSNQRVSAIIHQRTTWMIITMWIIITHMKTNIELKIIKAICTRNNLAWEDRNKESLQFQLRISTIGIIITTPRTLIYIIHLIIIRTGTPIKSFQTLLLSNDWIQIIIHRTWPTSTSQTMVLSQLDQWAWRERNRNSSEEDTVISTIIKMRTSTGLHSSMVSNLLNTAHMIDNMRFKACLKMGIEMLIIFQATMVMDLINPHIWWALAMMV